MRTIQTVEIMMNSKIIDFFSTRSVSHKLISGTLSEGQLFLYFYAIMLFDALNFVMGWMNIGGEQLTTSNLIFIWGYFIFTALGLIVLFLANGGFRGRIFIAKFFSFSVTVGIKYEIVDIVVAELPKYIDLLKIPHYGLITWWMLNTLMVINMAYRIYKTR